MVRFIPNAVSSKVALTALKLSKHSPHILFGAGLIGVATSAVLASRATLKIESILDEHNILLDQINEAITFQDYSEQDRKKDKALLYVQTVVQVTKLYGPALLVGGLAVAALSGSHHILTKRNAALTAAYAVIDKGFREYRERVVEDQGVEKDRQYLNGVVTEQISEPSEDGKSVKVSQKQTATATSPYGVVFDETNSNWTNRPHWNLMWLRGHQSYLNDLFQAQGYLFLSDVYDAIGVPQTKASRVVGWHKKSKNGDNFIDFGLFDDSDTHQAWEYAVGKNNELYLDFNVDGVVHDLL